MSFVDHWLCRIDIFEDAEIDQNDIEEIREAKFKLFGKLSHCVLFVSPEFGSITPEGRKEASSPLQNENAIAKAIIVKNIATRLVSNFFIRFNKPQIPVKVFENEKEALIWLSAKWSERK